MRIVNGLLIVGSVKRKDREKVTNSRSQLWKQREQEATIKMRTETSNIKELRDMHLIGHTCLSLNGELLLVWGGSSDSDEDEDQINTDIWIFETLTGYWRRKKCSGECPPYTSSATSALIGKRMFVFGGQEKVDRISHWTNSLYCLDLETFIWTNLGIRAKAEPTMPIKCDKCVSWTYDGKFYIFGGYGWSQIEHMLHLLDRQKDLQLAPDSRWPRFGWNNQLVEYDPKDDTWRWPSYKGKCPSARAAHSGALIGDTYYIFGGRDCQERLNDMYTFDMKTFEWNQITVSSGGSLRSSLRPIGHLLEDSLEAGSVNENHSSSSNETTGQMVDDDESETVDEEMIQESLREIDYPAPSPSTSCPLGSTSIATATTTNRNHTPSASPSWISDDEDDEPYEYPHPSHLLERGSLSSNHSSSNRYDECLNEMMNLTNQEHQQQHQQSRPMDQAYVNNGNSNNSNGSDDNNTIYEATSQQQQQQPQQQHEAVNPLEIDNDQLVASGGGNSDLDRKQQEPLVPVGRSFSSFTPISDQDILLYGGVSSQDKNLDDCWLFNINKNHWTPLDLKNRNKPRLWHTGCRTKSNEVVIIGGSSSDKVNEFCTDVFSISMEPKSLKRLALDATARSVRMRSIRRVKGLPATIMKLIKLRKQAVVMNMRGTQRASTINTN